LHKRNSKPNKSLKIIFGVLIISISSILTIIFINSDLNKDYDNQDIYSIFTKCSEKYQSTILDSREYCYSSEFKKISAQYGSTYAFEKLEELKKIDTTAQGCHWIAHGIGTGEYLKNPNSWRQSLTKISQTCNYGAQHGIVEEYVETLPEGKITKENIISVCGETPINDCNHIVGHIVLVSFSGDIDQALNICKVFIDTLQNHYCNQGVFMENITALNLIDHKIVTEKYLDWSARLDEMEQMCKKYSDPIAMACWEEITHASVIKYFQEPNKIFLLCGGAPSSDGRNKCKTHAIGILTASYGYNLNEISKLCQIPQILDPDFENQCYADIVGSTLSTVPEKLSQTIDFCDNLANHNFASKCFTMIYTVSNSGLYSKDSIKKTCSGKNRNYGDLCLVEDDSGRVINIGD